MAFFPRHFVASAVLAALTLPVLAQTAPPAAATTPSAQTQAQTNQAPSADGQMRRAPNRAKMQERMAQRQAALKQSLQLSAEQEPAWNTFIGTMQPAERTARLGPLSREEMQKLTTPERIDRMQAQRAQRGAEADRRGEAVKAFYAQLTPAQQKTFDAHTARYHRHMDHMGQMGQKEGMGGRGYRDGGKNHHQERRDMGRRDKAPAAPMPQTAPAPAPAQ